MKRFLTLLLVIALAMASFAPVAHAKDANAPGQAKKTQQPQRTPPEQGKKADAAPSSTPSSASATAEKQLVFVELTKAQAKEFVEAKPTKITSNAQSEKEKATGIAFAWVNKQKDDGRLTVDAKFFEENKSVTFVIKASSSYFSAVITEPGTYAVPRPVVKGKTKNINYVLLGKIEKKDELFFTVTFVGFSSAVIATLQVRSGKKIDAAKAPVVANTQGWLVESSGNPFSLDTPITADIRLYPWAK